MERKREDFMADSSGLESGEENGLQNPTVEGAKSPFFGNAQELMARYSHCVVCNARLHFTHMTDFSQNLTQETARCPECGICMHRSVHKLQ